MPDQGVRVVTNTKVPGAVAMQYLKTLVVLCCAVFLFINTPARAAGPMLVTGNPEAPPIVWKKGDRLVGIGPWLAETTLKPLGVDYVIRPDGTWAEVQEKAKSGAVDLIVSAYRNRERETYLDFSEPYLESPVVVITKKGNGFVCNCWTDLVGKKGVAHTGESFGDKFDAYIKARLDVTYTTYNRAFEMLGEGTADYMIIDLYPAVIYSKLLQVEDRIEFMDKPATVQYFCMAFSRKSPHRKLLPEINRQIRELKKKGAIKKMLIAQYKSWKKTFDQRRLFYARSQIRAQQAQQQFDAGARDRGLDTMARFIERDIPYMNGASF